MKFSIDTYRANKNDKLSVYVLSDEDFEIDEAIQFLADNYDNHENCELVEENEPSCANYLGYKYCVVFHEEIMTTKKIIKKGVLITFENYHSRLETVLVLNTISVSRAVKAVKEYQQGFRFILKKYEVLKDFDSNNYDLALAINL